MRFKAPFNTMEKQKLNNMKINSSLFYKEDKMAINYKKCPKCGSKNSGQILYGEPTYEAFQESEKGIIKLGGCIIRVTMLPS
jgi:hypothetical protein